MACYIITYDLLKPGRDYAKLYDAIKSYGTWAHIAESVWAVVTAKTAVQVRDHLQGNMDSGDRIFVVKSSSEAARGNVICKNTWLKEHL